MKGKYEKCQGAVCRKEILILMKLMEMVLWILETSLTFFHVIFKFVGLTVQLWQYSDCLRILRMVVSPKIRSGKVRY